MITLLGFIKEKIKIKIKLILTLIVKVNKLIVNIKQIIIGISINSNNFYKKNKKNLILMIKGLFQLL